MAKATPLYSTEILLTCTEVETLEVVVVELVTV